ncbi:MAG: transposase [Anaeromyxobacteraceae bacterium]
MTAPRQVLPGTTYLVTRRCAQRQFLLQPSNRTTNPVFMYLLAVAARRYDIRVHAFCVMSNHFHLILTDPHARLPAFHQFLDALVARALNAALGRWEAFWAPNSYSAVRLVSGEDVVEKTAYVLANPVAAGLVGTGSVWPGLWSPPEVIGNDALVVARPEHFFDPQGGMPERVALALTIPPGFEDPEQFRRAVVAAATAREEKARSHWGPRGGFAGIRRILAQKPTTRPRGEERRRTLKPRVASRDRWKRTEVLGRLAEFLDSYRNAWMARRDGTPDVVFPAGTYQLRVFHDVRCAGAG